MGLLRKRIGGFYLTRQIGAGGMSEVYLAEHPRTGQLRAAKILRRSARTHPRDIRRFLQEVEIIRALQHPHIIRIFDSGVEEEFYYYTMEYLPGGNLSSRMETRRPSLENTVALAIPICSALAFAHQKEIVHRDLKPANVLLDASGSPKVADFGIAKKLSSTGTGLTRTDEVLGTMAYLAPEQRLSAKRVTPRTDVYALGALIYELTMGFPPLGRFPWPDEMHPAFPKNLQRILERALQVQPEDRYSDAGEMLRDLEEAIHGVMVTRPSSACRIDPGAKPCDAARETSTQEWLEILRTGTTQERMKATREMAERVSTPQLNDLTDRYEGFEEKIRWGLLRVFGLRRLLAAAAKARKELENPMLRERAVECLGMIGDRGSFEPLRHFLSRNPASAMFSLIPLARTGREEAIPVLTGYLEHQMATLRQASAKALAEIPVVHSTRLLRNQLVSESDERVRAEIRNSLRTIELQILQQQDTVSDYVRP